MITQDLLHFYRAALGRSFCVRFNVLGMAVAVGVFATLGLVMIQSPPGQVSSYTAASVFHPRDGSSPLSTDKGASAYVRPTSCLPRE